MALFNPTNSYKILAIYRSEDFQQDATMYAVAYRSQMHGEAWYKVRYANNYLLDKNPQKVLIESAYSQGGSPMAVAMEYYLKWTGPGWDQVSFSVDTDYETAYVDSGYPYKTFPTSQKITIDQDKSYEQMNAQSLFFGKEYSYSAMEWKDIGYTTSKDLGFQPLSKAPSSSSGADAAVSSLPGLTATVKHPPIKENDLLPDCVWSNHDNTNLRNMIIHLNDSHRWTREEVADWLETLDVDLRFKSPEDKLKEAKHAQLEEFTSKLTNAQTSLKMYTASLESTKAKIAEYTEQITKLQEEINVQD